MKTKEDWRLKIKSTTPSIEKNTSPARIHSYSQAVKTKPAQMLPTEPETRVNDAIKQDNTLKDILNILKILVTKLENGNQ